MKCFSTFHPVSLLIYFVCVLSVGMFVNNPVILALSLIGSICFYAFQGKRRFLYDLLFYFFIFIIVALVNPIFSHNGMTVLFFLNGNPITYEAIIYGLAIAAMIVSVLYWFKSFTIIMTSDKFLYLFCRAIPNLSVVLSAALRYIPLFRRQAAKINKTQTALGLYSSGNYVDNVKGTMRVFSIVITWSLENAIDTADSMRARGYGLHGRTQFSIFHFRIYDAILIIESILLFIITVSGIAYGNADFTFYPKLSTVSISPLSIITYTAYGVLAFLPFLYEIKENLRWTFCKSKI